MRRVLFFIALLFLIISCTKNNVYENNRLIPSISWNAKDKLSFPVIISDTSCLYNIYINIRHTEDYYYRNIWLMTYATSPDGKTTSERVELNLADEEGKWFGQGVNNIWDARILLQSDTRLNEPGKYIFTLEQDMREDPLPGIMAVGIRIEKHPRIKTTMQLPNDTAAISNQ